MTSAPRARIVDALTGARAPDKFIAALSEADNLCAELDTLREIQCRLAEVEADRDAYRESANDLAIVLQGAFADISAVKAENAELSERLEASREAHEVTRGLLAQARRDLARVSNERDTLRAAVSAGAR
jgi:chromosome segregation ATPase